jgi:uncharacterized protein (DUF4415 family)
MKKAASKRFTPKQWAELQSLTVVRGDAIDTSDAPELLDWSGAKRGLFYRPVKQQLTLRLDADVAAWFKSHTTVSEGCQTRIKSGAAGVCPGTGGPRAPIEGLVLHS